MYLWSIYHRSATINPHTCAQDFQHLVIALCFPVFYAHIQKRFARLWQNAFTFHIHCTKTRHYTTSRSICLLLLICSLYLFSVHRLRDLICVHFIIMKSFESANVRFENTLDVIKGKCLAEICMWNSAKRVQIKGWFVCLHLHWRYVVPWNACRHCLLLVTPNCESCLSSALTTQCSTHCDWSCECESPQASCQRAVRAHWW